MDKEKCRCRCGCEKNICRAWIVNKTNHVRKIETSTTTDKTENDQKQAAEKLAKMEADIQREIDASTIAAMQEGKEKKLKEIENDYNQRIDVIEERKKSSKK
jgi:hypothetical protein